MVAAARLHDVTTAIVARPDIPTAPLSMLPGAVRQAVEFARRYPHRAITAALLVVLAVLALSRTFANPHGCNRALFWDGCTITLLRNWPLVWIDTHPWLQVLSSLNVVLMTLAVTLVLAQQPHRRELWLAIGAGLAMPFANNLVEPRYFIAGVAFVWLFLRLEIATVRWLTWWSAAICVAHAPFIARGLSLW
jgi:hypothetical protein